MSIPEFPHFDPALTQAQALECVPFLSAEKSLQYYIMEATRSRLEERFGPLPDVEWWSIFHRSNPMIVWKDGQLDLETYGAERVFHHARDYHLATLSEQEPEYYSEVTRYLARKVLACTHTSKQVLQDIEGLSAEEALPLLRRHVDYLCTENLQAEKVHYAQHYTNPYASVEP